MKGLVIKTTGSWHLVEVDNKIIKCKIKGNLRQREIKTTNPVAVGDIVEISLYSDDEAWLTNILPRKNYIIRKASKLSKEAQIIASNIDQAMLIITIKLPETLPEFIDRFLVTAETYFIPAILIFNKYDLLEGNEEDLKKLQYFMNMYEKIGYKCIETSALTGKNICKLKEMLKEKITLISGNSGVGKSSLLNKINPEWNLKTNEISAIHEKGRHTTTYPQMLKLPDGGYVIDTPGIKSFGLIDIEPQEVGLRFPEIFKYSKNCKYNNCMHLNEPDCAVIKALENGDIEFSRYRSYVNIVLDENEKYRPAY